MDLVIIVSILAMAAFSAYHTALWVKEKYAPSSPHLRSAGMMYIVIAMLIVLLFGARLVLKPEVSLTYTERTFDLFSSQSVTDKGVHVIETKKIVGCEVELAKSYPLMLWMGRNIKTIKFKMPCDLLLPEMKSEVASLTAHLKEAPQ